VFVMCSAPQRTTSIRTFTVRRLASSKEAVPKVAKLGILISRGLLEKTAGGAATKEAAQRAGIELILPTIEAPFWREEEYRAAFTRMSGEGVDGVVVDIMNENWTYRRLIIALAEEFRLPAIYPALIFVELGGLMRGAKQPPAYAGGKNATPWHLLSACWAPFPFGTAPSSREFKSTQPLTAFGRSP
jgi:hypothetical protein